MTVRSRLLPMAALLVAVATAVAISVALSGPAGAIVSTTPDWGGSSQCQTNGRVNAVAYLGGTIYLGGSFTAVEGQPRGGLAACDAASGNLLSWNPNANGVVRALKVSPAGTRVYAGGDFTAVGGAIRARVA
ncbi:MAG TPA: laminin G, partial [Actinomycetes bacterium]